jgi:hypothetical protein
MISSAYQQMANGGVPFIPLTPQADAKDEGTVARAPDVDARVQDLLTKLEAAEARVKKLETTPTVGRSDEDKEVQEEIKAETRAERSKIADLQKEIDALKAQVTASKKEESAGRSPASTRTATTSGEASGTPIKPTKDLVGGSSQTPNTKGSNSTSSTGNGTGNSSSGASVAGASAVGASSKGAIRSGGDRAILTTAGSVGGVTTIKLASGDTVTSFAGLAPERVAEIISTRFKNPDLKKLPFFIEEAGYVKEVVPMLDEKGDIILDANGNPTYVTAIKGKLGDKKFAIAKTDAPSRTPAAVTDRADLSRKDNAEVERLRKRAEYERLKKMTTDAIKKKD